MSTAGIGLAERGLLPDAVAAWGIRRLLADRLRQEGRGDCEARRRRCQDSLEGLRLGPIALSVEKPNEQHEAVERGAGQGERGAVAVGSARGNHAPASASRARRRRRVREPSGARRRAAAGASSVMPSSCFSASSEGART